MGDVIRIERRVEQQLTVSAPDRIGKQPHLSGAHVREVVGLRVLTAARDEIGRRWLSDPRQYRMHVFDCARGRVDDDDLGAELCGECDVE